MEKKLILCGIVAGTIGGVLAFVFGRVFAEPRIEWAIGYEGGRNAAQEALDRAAGQPVPSEGPELFSRTLQGTVGVGVGVVLFGIAMGALFAVVYSVCLGRVGKVGVRPLALLVAAGGFLGVYLVPFVKYPANPPAIGHAETIGERGGLYLLMVLCSVVSLVLAVLLGRWLRGRFGTWNASLLAGAAFLVAIGLVMLLLPSLGQLQYNLTHYGNFATETPRPLTGPDGTIVFPGFSADVLFAFRLYSVGAQLILWAAIGLCFAPMAVRVLRPVTSRATPEPVTS